MNLAMHSPGLRGKRKNAAGLPLTNNPQNAEDEEAEGRERQKKSSRFLSGMRSCMAIAVLAIVFAIGQLVFAFWTHTPAAPNKVLQGDARNARA